MLSAVLFFTTGAEAQSILHTYSKPLSNIALLPKAEFEAVTALYEKAPLNDAALAFSVRLPRGWVEGKDVTLGDALVQKIPTDLVRFYSPPSLEAQSTFIVQGVKLEYAQTAQQWFVQYLIANGFGSEGMKIHSKTRAEALYVGVEGYESYIIRSVIEMNGKYVLMAQFKMPLELWETHKKMQAQVIESFRIENRVDEPVEPMRPHRFLDIASMEYPASWEMRVAGVKSVESMGLDLFNAGAPGEYDNKNRALNGKISVRLNMVAPEDNLAQKLQKTKDELNAAGIVLKGPIEKKEKPVLDPSVQKMIFETYRASYANNPQLDYEVWVTLFRSGNYMYAVTMETPSRGKDYFIWARNTETYRLILKSLKPTQ
ncbi:MAG: hypothetical protein ACT4OY_01330 [Alphaproteobacteria bacterium]